MKKYVEIQAEIARNAETIRKESERLNALTWTEKKDADNGLKIAEKIDALRLENAILNDNARRAFVAEKLPAVLEILSKYAGKKYGPKTRDKIYGEIKTRLNVGFYATFNYSGGCDSISLAPLNKDGFTHGDSYNKFNLYTEYKKTPFINDENVIQKVSADAVTLSNCGEYVENVAERVKQIREKWQAMQDAAKKLDATIAEFNTVCASSIKGVEKAYNVRSYLI